MTYEKRVMFSEEKEVIDLDQKELYQNDLFNDVQYDKYGR